jgi:Tfp pilus assembly protein PilX
MSEKMKNKYGVTSQQGTVMITTLMILIILTIVVLSGSQNSTMQLKMSSNLQSRMEAMEFAQAGLDFAESIDPVDIPISANNLCTTYHPDADDGSPTLTCDTRLAMPSPFDNTSSTGTSWMVLKRDTGLEGSLPRCPEG